MSQPTSISTSDRPLATPTYLAHTQNTCCCRLSRMFRFVSFGMPRLASLTGQTVDKCYRRHMPAESVISPPSPPSSILPSLQVAPLLSALWQAAAACQVFVFNRISFAAFLIICLMRNSCPPACALSVSLPRAFSLAQRDLSVITPASVNIAKYDD